jgi:methionyl-tRNA formyltransferase
MKIAFFGTPEFAIPSLTALVRSSAHEVVCVVTQPDKPSGRGGEVRMGAVKQFALANGIAVLQPERISNTVNILDPFKPDIIVTCAFGQMLRENVLKYCNYGVINVHASLLPKYRGSSPIQWAVINGEKTTGITIMQTDIGMDTGDIILKVPVEIEENETAGDLTVRLAEIGALALLKALEQIENKTARFCPQNNFEASVFPMLSKETARINWTRSAFEINNLIRGLNPWPIAYFSSGVDVRVYRATPIDLEQAKQIPYLHFDDKSFVQFGTVLHASSTHGMFICCNRSVLRLDVIQIPGGRAIETRDFLNGRSFAVGTILH